MASSSSITFGVPCWIDLSTSDKPRALAFYGGLFDWTATESGEEFGHYSIVSSGDVEVGGMMQKMPGMEGGPMPGASTSPSRMLQGRWTGPSRSARSGYSRRCRWAPWAPWRS